MNTTRTSYFIGSEELRLWLGSQIVNLLENNGITVKAPMTRFDTGAGAMFSQDLPLPVTWQIAAGPIVLTTSNRFGVI